MPEVTQIKPQKKKDRFNIFLDGVYAFSLSAEDLVKAGLRVDQILTQEQINKLIKEGEFSLIFDKVLKFLSFRPRSTLEISQYLFRKKTGGETQKIILEKLENLKFIDDKAFALWWVEQRSGFRPTGKSLLKAELRQKGICKEVIEEMLGKEGDIYDEKEAARKLLEKKMRTLAGHSPLEIKKKLYGILGRKGFSYETIEETIANLLKKE